MTPEQKLYQDMDMLDQAEEMYDKLIFNSERLKEETLPMARFILGQIIDSYLDAAKTMNIAPLFTEIKAERESYEG